MEEDHVEVVVAAEGVAPRQPVDEHRRVLAEEGPDLRDGLLVRAEHPVRVGDALRLAGRAGREEDLGDAARAHLRLHRRVEQPVLADERSERAFAASAGQERAVPAEGVERGPERRFGVDEDRAGAKLAEDRAELAVVGAAEAVGGAHRRDRNAREHGAEGEERVVDRVAARHEDRPLGPPVGHERAGDALGSGLRFAVGHLAKRSARGLGQEDAVGVSSGGAAQQAAQRRWRRRQRRTGAEIERSVPLLGLDGWRGERNPCHVVLHELRFTP